MNKEVEQLIEDTAKRLFEWHCEVMDIPQELLANQNVIVKDYWTDKAKQILCGHRLAIIDKSRERDNKVWHKSEELFEAYQAGKNDASLIIIPLEEE